MSVVGIRREGNVAVVTIDNPPVNAASQAVRAGLLEAVRDCDADPDVRAVVLACAGRTFVAGADIREFGQPPAPPHLPDVVAAIEAAQTPWVAALHGTALGGGLELAMGCHARIAAPDARLGLPEVNLGLIPGAGGTVRLPRLVPATLALTMVAGGKPVSAREARTAGLVDAIAEDDLLAEALALAAGLDAPARTLDRSLPTRDAGYEATAERLRRRARGQASIPAAIDAVDRAFTMSANAALEAERDAFVQLKNSPQSAALRHIFFAERGTLSDPRCKGPTRPIDRIAVIGGGTMGAGIAAACLLRGLPVAMIERDGQAAEAGLNRITDILDGSRKRGLLSDAALKETMDHLSVSTDYAGVADADLVIEAVFEDMTVKREVFTALDAATRPDAILATNTSYLDVGEIASVVADPSRVVGLHFFSPAHVMKLLEIVTPGTVADDVVATAAALAKRLGKIGVLAGVCDGFIGNRIMSAYRREADYLVEDGAAPESVDAAMRDFGFPMGIFEMQDLAGLDIGWATRKRKAATRDPAERYVAIADRICEAGRFGRKTGGGWYDYADGRPVPSPAVAAIIDAERSAAGLEPRDFGKEEIMDRILAAMRSEARAVLAEGIARSAADIDVVMVNGYGFPRWRGGPLFGQDDPVAPGQ